VKISSELESDKIAVMQRGSKVREEVFAFLNELRE
jgi:hypothetical protein